MSKSRRSHQPCDEAVEPRSEELLSEADLQLVEEVVAFSPVEDDAAALGAGVWEAHRPPYLGAPVWHRGSVHEERYVDRYDSIPYDDWHLTKHEDIKRKVEDLYLAISAIPGNRARSLAITKLDESFFWVGAAIKDAQRQKSCEGLCPGCGHLTLKDGEECPRCAVFAESGRKNGD